MIMRGQSTSYPPYGASSLHGTAPYPVFTSSPCFLTHSSSSAQYLPYGVLRMATSSSLNGPSEFTRCSASMVSKMTFFLMSTPNVRSHCQSAMMLWPTIGWPES